VVIFTCYELGPKWIANYQLRQDLYRFMVNAKTTTDQQIVVKITATAAERGMPLGAEQIACRRPDETQIHCEYSFQWPVVVAEKHLFDLPIHESIDRPITNVIR